VIAHRSDVVVGGNGIEFFGRWIFALSWQGSTKIMQFWSIEDGLGV
jgi:hypothetical protein